MVCLQGIRHFRQAREGVACLFCLFLWPWLPPLQAQDGDIALIPAPGVLVEKKIPLDPDGFVIRNPGTPDSPGLPAGSRVLLLPRAIPLEGVVKTLTVETLLPGTAASGGPFQVILSRKGYPDIFLPGPPVPAGTGRLTWAVPPPVLTALDSPPGGLFLKGFRILGAGTGTPVKVTGFSCVTDLWKDDTESPGPAANPAPALTQAPAAPAAIPSVTPRAPVSDPAGVEAFRAFPGSLAAASLTPGFQGLRLEYLKAFQALDPRTLLDWLQRQGEDLWQVYRPDEVLDIIGWDSAPFLDNLWYHSLCDPGPQGMSPVRVLAGLPEARNPQVLGDLARFRGGPLWTPRVYRILYREFIDWGLPAGGLVASMRYQAGLDRSDTTPRRSHTRRERMFQGLLVRLGLLDKLPEDPSGTNPRTLRSIPALAPLSLDNSLARILAGRAAPDDIAALTGADRLPPDVRRTIAREMEDAPLDLLIPRVSQALSDMLSRFPSSMPEWQRLPPATSPGELDDRFRRRKLNPAPVPAVSPAGNDYHVPAREGDYWFPASPRDVQGVKVTESAPGDRSRDPVKSSVDLHAQALVPSSLSLEVRSRGSRDRICAAFIDARGQEREFFLGTGNFEGLRTLTYRVPDTLHLPPLRFREIRVYHAGTGYDPDPRDEDLDLEFGSLLVVHHEVLP